MIMIIKIIFKKIIYCKMLNIIIIMMNTLRLDFKKVNQNIKKLNIRNLNNLRNCNNFMGKIKIIIKINK